MAQYKIQGFEAFEQGGMTMRQILIDFFTQLSRLSSLQVC